MDFTAMVSAMAPDTYNKLAEAVATGRWADGTPLSAEQKEQTLQLVLAYQSKVLKSQDIFTVGPDGQIVHKSKAELKKQFSDPAAIARFSHDDL
ncbi:MULTISPECIES: YeaC family protein [Gammaproteobacteria]|uniref:YeaC family protein n=1 Tax=Gammaproteobacteria TaxID=1236 RepID=UPI001E4ED0FB|nr:MULTISPECIES: DUF1315 family protein [Gammaproteobacteria]MDP5035615.1 DUF1315 family protein [Alishewanella sp.]MCC5451699.1 DUF1315 family protein [Rheinheimera sp. UJ51]MCF4009694.1 DUF1315 family protein [Rheinheimera sp. UJ63]MDP5186692.1 DUF1315 family protein [Alishewanella sp.]MDP5460713.1 DUF1315 family protein [Alishewanella sp. SMS8]